MGFALSNEESFALWEVNGFAITLYENYGIAALIALKVATLLIFVGVLATVKRHGSHQKALILAWSIGIIHIVLLVYILIGIWS